MDDDGSLVVEDLKQSNLGRKS